MSNNCLQDKLSEYLDGELQLGERAAVEAHLTGCATCAKIVDDLRRVVRRAEGLDDRAPTRELWAGVAARIGASVKPDAPVVDRAEGDRQSVTPIDTRKRRLTITVPQLLAASIALVAISASTVWLAVQNGPESQGLVEPMMVAEQADQQSTVIPAAITSSYADATADLERILEAGRDRLAPETIRVIEENLTIIDNAVARARQALANDPGSEYLREHLAQTMLQKLTLLRRVTSLTNAS